MLLYKKTLQTGRKCLKNIYIYKNVSKRSEQPLTKEDIQMANKCVTGCVVDHCKLQLEQQPDITAHLPEWLEQNVQN